MEKMREMKAVVLKEFGSIDNLIVEEINIPVISDDEVLVKVKAISINPVDCKTRRGGTGLAEKLEQYDPLILGWDISGVVEKVGKEVTDLKQGQEVFGMINFIGHGKAYAEYVAAKPSDLALKPKNISHVEAAATTLAALTAWQAFTHFGHLKSGDKVLIQAASGGVGHFAVQIAKHLGAYVIGTSSAKNRDFVLSLGADQHIDYQTQNFEEELSGVDFVLEAMGHANFQKSVDSLKEKGTIVNLPSGVTEEDQQYAHNKNLKACFYMSVYSDGEDMRKLADLLEKKIIKPHIYQVFDFPDVKAAHQQIDTGRTVGKVVVKMQNHD